MSANIIFVTPDASAPDMTVFPSVSATAKPVVDIIHPLPGETLGDIVKRAYGVVTHDYRELVRAANNTLEGPINAPR